MLLESWKGASLHLEFDDKSNWIYIPKHWTTFTCLQIQKVKSVLYSSSPCNIWKRKSIINYFNSRLILTQTSVDILLDLTRSKEMLSWKKLSRESSQVKFKNGIHSTCSSFHCSSKFQVLVESFSRTIVIFMHLKKMFCPIVCSIIVALESDINPQGTHLKS